MKPFYLLLLAASCSLDALAGPADTVLNYFDKDWKEVNANAATYYRKAWKEATLWVVRDYFMSGQLQMSGAYSDDSLKISEGPFSYYHRNGRLSQTCTYVNDAPEGALRQWYENGKPSALAFYRNGNAEGISRTWYLNGTLADSTNYKEGRLEGMQFWYFENGQVSEEGVYRADSPINVKLWTAEGAPDPAGAANELSPAFRTRDGKSLPEYLQGALKYPRRARRRNQEGRAIIEFVVKSNGDVRDCVVVKSSGTEDLDQEALRVVRGMPAWQPGRLHNRPVEVWFTLPIIFELESKPRPRLIRPS
jgi:TonB family protein